MNSVVCTGLHVAATYPKGVPRPSVEEVGRVLPVTYVAMGRYEFDGTMTVVATSSNVGDRFPVGGR